MLRLQGMPQQRFDLLGGEPEKELLLLFWYRYVWNGAKKDEWKAAASRRSTGRLWLADGRNKIFVAELEGRVIGYVHLADYDVLYAPPMKNIMGIAVSPQYRRKGVGRVLLEAGEKWAAETGAAGVRLVSGESRTEAHAFYRSLGYQSPKRQINLKKVF